MEAAAPNQTPAAAGAAEVGEVLLQLTQSPRLDDSREPREISEPEEALSTALSLPPLKESLWPVRHHLNSHNRLHVIPFPQGDNKGKVTFEQLAYAVKGAINKSFALDALDDDERTHRHNSLGEGGRSSNRRGAAALRRRVVMLCVDATEVSKETVKWAAAYLLRPSDVVVLTAAWEEATQRGFFSRSQTGSSLGVPTTPLSPHGAGGSSASSHEAHQSPRVALSKSPRGSTSGTEGAGGGRSVSPRPHFQHHYQQSGGNGTAQHHGPHGSGAVDSQRWQSKQAMVAQYYREHLSTCDVFPLFIPLHQKTTKSQVGQVLCLVSEILKATMVVVGTNSGMGAVKRSIVGSVSKHVVEHAHCPVIVVKR